MTPIELIEELAKELESIFKGQNYKSSSGKYVPLNIYEHALPINETDDDPDRIPYLIIRLNSGKDPGTRDSNNTVKLVIIIGIWDNSLNQQGYRDVLNIIQKIYERFQKNPNLNNKAVYDGEFDWLLQEDDYNPFFFGACSLKFSIAAIRREDPFI